jgi:ribosome-associated protein
MVVHALHHPPPRKRTRPSRGVKERRLQQKKSLGQRKSERRGNRDASEVD